jgi:hypothetical protein
MADIYYVVQVKTLSGTWVNLDISANSLEEINILLAKEKINKEIRIVQRMVKLPAISKKIPGCC